MDEPSSRFKTFQMNEAFLWNVNKIVKNKHTKLPEVSDYDRFQRSCFDSSQSKRS